MKKDFQHGGARIGAGRKINTGKFKEKTQVMRIPISLVNNVGQALKEYKKEIDNSQFLRLMHQMSAFHFFPLEFKQVSHHLRMTI